MKRRMRPEDLGIGRLFERVRDAVIVADAQTQRVVLWNPAATNVFGYSLSEALELRVEALVPEPLKAHHRVGIARYAETGHGAYIDSHRPLDLPALKKGGEEIRIELSLSPIGPMDGDGGRFVLAIVRDITKRKQAEEALRRSEERYRLVAQATNEAIWDSDVLADRQIWNGAVETMFGYPAGLQTNAAWWEEHVHPDDRERVLAGIDEVLNNRGEMWSEEYRFRRADGEYATVIDRAYVVRDGKGKPIRVIGSMMDLTKRKQAEEEIRHLNETLEKRVMERTTQLAERESRLRELLGKLVVAQEEERRRVAYEVHDGLAQMIVAVQQHLQAFAKQYPPDSSEGRERLDWTLELAQQTVDETRRVIAGLRPTALDDFGLATALRLQVEALRSEGWEIDYHETLGDERLPAALETVLYRVVQEALTNVRKHAHTTRVRVRLGCLGRKVRLRVRDWGTGFETAELVGGGGPGERVGISGMAERVVLLGGEFKVRSRPGAGTLIVTKVPLTDSEEDVEHG